MTEEQRSLWTMPSPVCSEYNIALQHKEVTEARTKRDQSDLAKLGEKLEVCNQFSAGDPSLRNITTGVVADDNVEFCTVGQKIIDKLVMCASSATPHSLLKVVHCNCQTACTSRPCTCRRYGLPCTSACGQDQVESCENLFNPSPDMDSDLDDTDNCDIYLQYQYRILPMHWHHTTSIWRHMTSCYMT